MRIFVVASKPLVWKLFKTGSCCNCRWILPVNRTGLGERFIRDPRICPVFPQMVQVPVGTAKKAALFYKEVPLSPMCCRVG